MIRKTTDNTKFDNKIFNEDCRQTIQKMIQQGYKVDNIITSPFYNTGRSSQCHTSQKSRDNHEGRYDIHLDDMTNDEYIKFTVDLFLSFDKILQDNGCILYNMSYGSENTELMWLTIASIIQNTPFTIADDIIWKKNSALPNNVSPNKLTRIVEHVLAFCRKSEFKTFKANKKVKSISKTGQKYYENVFNFIEAQKQRRSKQTQQSNIQHRTNNQTNQHLRPTQLKNIRPIHRHRNNSKCLPACPQYHLHRKRNKQKTMRIRRKKNTSHKNSISPKSKRHNNCRKILKRIKVNVYAIRRI